jgi:hypothetical protein
MRCHCREGSERSALTLCRAEEMNYRHAMREHVVGDNATVAAPPDGLGTHDRACFTLGELEQGAQRILESSRFSVVRIIVKRPELPAGVHAHAYELTLGAPSAERLHVSIGDSCTPERRSQGLAVKPRVGPRARNASHVNDMNHSKCVEYVDELTRAARGMPDGIERSPTQFSRRV